MFSSKLYILVVLIVTFSSPCYSQIDFGYDDQSTWPGICTTGHAQSPVDIDVNPSKANKHGFISSESSIKGDSFKIRNTGESVTVRLLEETATGLFPGEGLSSTKFCFDNAHFHWGSSSKNGSEHTIRGRSSALEVHFVHYNCEFDSLKSALDSGRQDAIAVAGILCDINPSSKPNKALSPIISQLQAGQLKTPSGDFTTVDKPLDLLPLVPKRSFVYTYQGSLTTPTCNEQVTWFVFSSTKSCKVSESDLKALRSIKNSKGHQVRTNHRDLQSLNDREIQTLKLHSQY